MKIGRSILPLVLLFEILPLLSHSETKGINVEFDFFGSPVTFTYDLSSAADFSDPLSKESIQAFYNRFSQTNYQPVVMALLNHKEQYKLDDWIYYQLIRKAAQKLSPKAENYQRYTLYKWFFLVQSGYDATLSIRDNRILLYIQSNEAIYNIPYHMRGGKQYVCLNYHDYGSIDFEKEPFTELHLNVEKEVKPFSYKISQLPEFKPADYSEKELQFTYYETNYQFTVKLNPQVQTIFTNYPVVDYESYFNIPLSNETYRSLIPGLKKITGGMKQKDGVDYLMRFTRYAFLYESDTENFGKEKRLSPEQTILNKYSDCDDRAALFFYLVKEIYNLPMIVLSYPKHVTIAVKFDKPVGKPILYNGDQYTVCEPTPQRDDIKMGKTIKQLRKTSYEIAYVYNPVKQK
jgi:hypothetical protein